MRQGCYSGNQFSLWEGDRQAMVAIADTLYHIHLILVRWSCEFFSVKYAARMSARENVNPTSPFILTMHFSCNFIDICLIMAKCRFRVKRISYRILFFLHRQRQTPKVVNVYKLQIQRGNPKEEKIRWVP